MLRLAPGRAARVQNLMHWTVVACLPCVLFGCGAPPAASVPCTPQQNAALPEQEADDHGSDQGQAHDHGSTGHHHPSEPDSRAVKVAPAAGPEAAGSSREMAYVIKHQELKSFENNGNQLVGIATRSMGAQNFEVWRTSVAPGSKTPPHTHSTEEIFVFLRGKGRATVGNQVVEFEAPATVIAPAGVQHQFENTGTEPSDAVVIVGVGSSIKNPQGEEMQLPWRR